MKVFIFLLAPMLAIADAGIAQDIIDDDRGVNRTDAKTTTEDLARDLANPISSVISVPLQFNYNRGFADDNGKQYGFTISPVLPFQLSDNLNVVSRTVVPLINQNGVTPGGGSQFGLGQITQSLFFSPVSQGGLTWGVGPVLALPTATGGIPGDEWGAGLTGVALVQNGPWTAGALANHIWSITGENTSNTFLQPFLAYTTATAWTFSLNSEMTYNWKSNDWTVPITANLSKLVTIGGRNMSLGGGVRYWASSPKGGPEGWGASLDVTFLFNN